MEEDRMQIESYNNLDDYSEGYQDIADEFGNNFRSDPIEISTP